MSNSTGSKFAFPPIRFALNSDAEDLKDRKAEIITRLSSWAKKIKAQQAKPEDMIVTVETVSEHDRCSTQLRVVTGASGAAEHAR